MELESVIFARYAYDPDTGIVFNKNSKHKKPLGSVQKNRSSGKHYKTITVGNRLLRVHRVAWLLHYKEWPKGQIDHINGNGIDNRLKNLRCVTHAENGRNTKKKSNNSSGVNGVYKCTQTGKWRAEIMVNRKKHCLGRHSKLDDAKKARHEAEVKFGFHPNHGEDRPLF